MKNYVQDLLNIDFSSSTEIILITPLRSLSSLITMTRQIFYNITYDIFIMGSLDDLKCVGQGR
jgi:hypothetical protein